MEVKNITDILKDVYQKKTSIRRAAKDMELASPLDLALAEVELLDEDMGENDLKRFRKIVQNLYVEILKEKTGKLLEELDEDHPIRHLILDHVKITEFVEELSSFVKRVGDEKTRIIRKQKLDNIEKNMNEIKKHEKSEEDILFPRLEEEGLHGRIYMMENEHDEIDELMDELTALSENLVENKEKFIEKTDVLTYTLEFHAFIENNFLYPVALEKLDDWDDIEEEFELRDACVIKSLNKR